jgi:hypothetical protein
MKKTRSKKSRDTVPLKARGALLRKINQKTTVDYRRIKI